MFPLGVATLGWGPFDDFDDFLGGLGIKVYTTYPDLNVLVVGRQDWDDQLNYAIEARRGKELRVYSQEMFLALLRTGYDPLEESYIARQFGKGHRALEYIQDWGFKWPITRIVPSSSGSTVTKGMRDKSPLTILGYKAGGQGRNQQVRHHALSRAFFQDFNTNPELEEFMPEWGEPQSGKRLQKIAERISMNVDPLSAGGRRQVAVGHWLEDLKWLKTMFYEGKYTFPWPSPIVY